MTITFIVCTEAKPHTFLNTATIPLTDHIFPTRLIFLERLMIMLCRCQMIAGFLLDDSRQAHTGTQIQSGWFFSWKRLSVAQQITLLLSSASCKKRQKLKKDANRSLQPKAKGSKQSHFLQKERVLFTGKCGGDIICYLPFHMWALFVSPCVSSCVSICLALPSASMTENTGTKSRGGFRETRKQITLETFCSSEQELKVQPRLGHTGCWDVQKSNTKTAI